MKHLLRGLDVPFLDATFELGPRTIIGRAADADIQILDGSVSRQHVKIVVHDDDRVVLVDLGSANGTFVDRLEVDRRPLRPGSVIDVVGHRFVYEAIVHAELEASHEPQPGVVSGPSLRRTAPRLPLDEVETQLAGAKTRVSPANRWLGRPRISATLGRDDAVLLLDEVLDYRELRIKQLRGEDLLPLEESRIERLRHKLHRRLEGRFQSRRKFQRFSCSLQAQLRYGDGTATAVPVTDIGAGGARICVRDGILCPGEVVWLSVDVSDRFVSTPCVVFKTRVAWCEGPDRGAGLVFAGEARYAADPSSVVGERPPSRVMSSQKRGPG